MTFDQEALDRCVQCGLCLSACPTYQVTHREQHGPRGRIAGMRLLQTGEVRPADPEFVESMETCVQCRACEPACPSGVEFGALMEQARSATERAFRARGASGDEGRTPSPLLRRLRARVEDLGLAVLASRGALKVLTLVLALVQTLRLDRLLPSRWRVARRIQWRELFTPLRPASGEHPAHLFRGCVMDAWFRETHRATLKVLKASGYGVRIDPAPPCCGAVHLHMGREEQGKALARRVVSAYAGTDGEIVVNSAGCGAAMREYGRLLGTEAAAAFAGRVRDFAEVASGAELPSVAPLEETVVYQAPCHLKNVQGVDDEVDRLLARVPGLSVERPTDGELCCGAGGAYSLTQPELAGRMRERKVDALRGTGASRVLSANPGCVLHLEGAGIEVRHVAEIMAEALDRGAHGL